MTKLKATAVSISGRVRPSKHPYDEMATSDVPLMVMDRYTGRKEQSAETHRTKWPTYRIRIAQLKPAPQGVGLSSALPAAESPSMCGMIQGAHALTYRDLKAYIAQHYWRGDNAEFRYYVRDGFTNEYVHHGAVEFALDDLADVYEEIRGERARAHAKHGAMSMESTPEMDLNRLAILLEEVGEVAKEFNEARNHDVPVDKVALRKELIQVAAMATAWAEAIKVVPHG